MAGQVQELPKRYKVRVGGPCFPGPQPCPLQGGAPALQVTFRNPPCKCRCFSGTAGGVSSARRQAQGLPEPPEWGARGQRAQRPRPMAGMAGGALSKELSNMGLCSPEEEPSAAHPLGQATTGYDSSGLIGAARPASMGAPMGSVPTLPFQKSVNQSCCVSWRAAHAVDQCVVATECYQPSAPAQQVLLLCDDCIFSQHLCIGCRSIFHQRGGSMLILSSQLRICMLQTMPYTSCMVADHWSGSAQVPSKRTPATKHYHFHPST